MTLRDLELTNVIGTGYFVRLFDPETGIRDNESQYGPLTQDDVEDQLIALGVPIEQAERGHLHPLAALSLHEGLPLKERRRWGFRILRHHRNKKLDEY